MARKRGINPNIWEDPTFNSITRDARLLYIGMISNADDEGYIRADAGILKRTIFGFDDITQDEVEKWRKELENFRGLHFYKDNGELYAHLANFVKYQGQQKDRVQASVYPVCSKCVAGAKQVPTQVSKEVSKKVIIKEKEISKEKEKTDELLKKMKTSLRSKLSAPKIHA